MIDNTVGSGNFAFGSGKCTSRFFKSAKVLGAVRYILTMALFAKYLRIGSTVKHGFQAFPQLSVAKYSVYPPHYSEPIYKKQELEKMYESGEIENYKLIPFKAAKSNETCSVFHDPIVAKFINYMLLKGQKKLARGVLEKTFEKIKKLQLEKYNRETDPEKKASIIIDPVVILKKAVANCKPLLKLTAVKRGGSFYQVPVPITDKESTFYAMRWFVQCGREKDKSISFADFMANELINASNNDGKVVKKKLDLHKQCEANRAYAHYRFS